VATIYALHVALPSLFILVLVNATRMHRGAAAGAGWIGLLSALWLLIPLEGLQPSQAAMVLGFLLASLAGVSIAARGRENLELLARLHLLRQFLPPAGVERVLHEHPDAAVGLGGTPAVVTVLSSDLRGFTAMSENLVPAQVLEQLNAFHGAMLQVVDVHGGALDKFIGDGMLVVFGLDVLKLDRPPTSESTADAGAAAAVACARAMLEALAEHNRSRAKRGQPPLAMGIGLHTGPVVAGNLGAVGRRLEFTVIGDTVNTAARLEGLTKEAHVPVVISSDVVARLQREEGLRELPPMAVRGKGAPVRVFTFLDAA